MKKIKAIWRKLFPPNDWKLVGAHYAYWEQKQQFGILIYTSVYEIRHSQYRNKCEMKYVGLDTLKGYQLQEAIELFDTINMQITEATNILNNQK